RHRHPSCPTPACACECASACVRYRVAGDERSIAATRSSNAPATVSPMSAMQSQCTHAMGTPTLRAYDSTRVTSATVFSLFPHVRPLPPLPPPIPPPPTHLGTPITTYPTPASAP